jgi:hypothetical protein
MEEPREAIIRERWAYWRKVALRHFARSEVRTFLCMDGQNSTPPGFIEFVADRAAGAITCEGVTVEMFNAR